jgi:hypothetical protein
MESANKLYLKTIPKEDLYYRAMTRLIDTEGPINEDDKDKLKQYVFAGVKYIVTFRRNEKGSYSIKSASAKFELIDIIMGYMSELTPQELMIMFPVTKNYDGHKFQSKDYFTTIKAIKEYPLNKPIGQDNIFSLLWDYWNWDLNFFLVECMLAMSDSRRLQGKKGIAEEFCEKEGIETFTYHKEEGYMQSNKTGKVTKLHKKKRRVPKQFKIVK